MVNILIAQDESFILSTNKFQPYFPTYIGNGHFSLASSQLGSLQAESYMINVYDHGQDDIPRIAALPSWNEINYYDGNRWLNSSSSDSSAFKNYLQQLDMYNGELESKFEWHDGNKVTQINILNFISRKQKDIAVIKLELQPNFTDTIRLSFPLQEREKPKRLALAKLEKIAPDKPGAWPAAWYPGFVEVSKISINNDTNSGSIQLLSESEGKNTRVAIAVEVFFDKIKNAKVSSIHDNKSAKIDVVFKAEKGKKYSFYKVISIMSEKDTTGDIFSITSNSAKSARKKGYDQLFSDHKMESNNMWKTDIRVTGDDEFQRIIHSMMYYLLSSIDVNTKFSIPPMGLSTSGYYGHIFWDADTYMYPPLLLMNPELAKSMVMFRYNVLDAAMENARKNKYKGAMYPWESDESGNETTPYFAYQNAIGENHIVGDVAFAQWQYYQATKDIDWLRNFGFKVISATADFWTSRVHFNEKQDRYEIGRVVSVSEGLTDVNNETYTNVVAKLNLEIAIKAANLLKQNVNPNWEKIFAKILIPYNKEKEYYPTYENAAEGQGATELWSSVVPLLTYPLQIQMSENTKRNDLMHAVQSLDKNGAGANMGINFLPVIAAELGNDSLFNYTIEKTLKGYLRPPFNVLAETHTNNNVNFITGAGAFLQQVIFGYTGIRITDEGITQKYKPILPKNITSLTLKNFTINKEKYDIGVENGLIKMNHIK